MDRAQRIEMILATPAYKPVPGKDYGRLLANEIRRLRREERATLKLIELSARQGETMADRAGIYSVGVVREAARRVLPADVNADHVADGKAILEMIRAVEASPFRDGYSQWARSLFTQTNGGV